MKKILSTAAVLFSSQFGSAQSESASPDARILGNDTIVWRADSVLKREDFKAEAKPNDPYSLGATGIFYYTSERDEQSFVFIEAIFIKSQSLLNRQSEHIIKHEQLHFDLCELYTRKLRKRVAETVFKKGKHFQKEFQNLYDTVLAELDKDETKFEVESENGFNQTNQLMWREEIKKQLKELEQYKSPAVKIVKK